MSKPTNLRCQYLSDPLAIGSTNPRLSWIIEEKPQKGREKTARRGVRQSAFRILCASGKEMLDRDRADLWDSGQISSPDLFTQYRGTHLFSLQQVYWKIRIWDQDGKQSPWSDTAEFRIGHLREEDWEGRWIGTGLAVRHVVPLYRKAFFLESPPHRALLYASGLGVYEMYLNGRKTGEQVLAPEWTSYGKRVHYQVCDVAPLLRTGENVLAGMVAEGWYAGRIGLSSVDPSNPGYGIYGKKTALIAELRFEDNQVAGHDRGRTEPVVTDGSWKHSLEGPILASDILDGELYDARREIPHWMEPGFDDSDWRPVEVLRDVRTSLVPQPNEPVKIMAEIPPKKISEPIPDTYVVDLGQNIAGFLRLKIQENRGKTIRFIHGERLTPEGRVYTQNLRSARQIDEYISAGDGEAAFQPRFTFHGFQYAEIHGLSRKPRAQDITGCAVWSSFPQAGRFESSHELLNSIMSNILWTQRDNMLGVPTDCPQRDERLGWTGDIQIYCQTACYNQDMAAFLLKWLGDMKDDQRDDGRFPDFAPHPFASLDDLRGAPAWADAGVIVPWKLYLNYGDREILEEMYEPAKRWVSWIQRNNPTALWEKARGRDYGDWLNADTFKIKKFPKGRAEVPKEVFASAYYYRSADLLARMASVLGNQEDGRTFRGLADDIRSAFIEAYVDPQGMIKGDTQAGYALALEFGLLPEAQQEQAFQRLLRGIEQFQGHLSTGFLSTVPAMEQLVRFGHQEKAFELLTSTAFPSWGYTVLKGGTTIWERWDGWTEEAGFQDPAMNSFCHYAIGAVGEWVYRHVLGIQLLEDHPGFEEFAIKPLPGGELKWARGSYDSIRGIISVEWERRRDSFHLKATVPPCSRARIWVRSNEPAGVRVDDRKGILQCQEHPGFAVYLAESGTYTFTASLK